ncbi:MAG: hypothetical protein ABEJ23_05015 [Haloarculaceae archaeon]
MSVDLDRFGHDSFAAALGAFAGYAAVLVGMFVLLFVVPFVIFLVL